MRLPGFPKFPRRLRRLFIAGVLLAVLPLAFSAWLVTTSSGLNFSLQLATYASGGRLYVTGASGRWLDTFSLETLTWAADEPITLSGLKVDWSPALLRHGQLAIARVGIDHLHIIKRAASDEPAPPPMRLTLPFALVVERLDIARLDFGQTPLARNMTAHLASDGRHHAFAANWARDTLRFNLGGTLSGEGDMPLAATLDIDAATLLAGKPHTLTLHLAADGALLALPVEGRLLDGKNNIGRFSATLTPFAAQPLTALRARIQDFDPSRWLPNLPQARLDILADLALQDGIPSTQIRGHFDLRNKRAGSLDAHALPLEALTGNFLWHENTLKLTDLDARFFGQGRYLGHLEYKTPTLKAVGELTHIDPRRFLPKQLPMGDLAANFHLQLDLDAKQGQHALQLDFTLPASTLAGQKLQGGGRLRYAAARFQNVDIDLRLGQNHARFQGALGAAKDALDVTIVAPRLDIPPLVGDLNARLTLSTPSGKLDTPFIKGEADSDKLALPNGITLQGLRFQSDFNAQALTGAPGDEPFALKLSLAQLNSNAGVLRAGELELSGSPRAHRLTLDAELAAKSVSAHHLRLALTGGLSAARRWNGKLEELQLESPAATPAKTSALIKLTAPATLAVDAQRFTLDHANLQGNVGDALWQASINALAYPWTADQPLQGDIKLQSGNLAWLAPLLGIGYRAGGRVDAEIKLAGSPAAPRWRGFIHADALSFAALDMGLRLESGRLRLSFDENMLRLESFQFSNPHTPLPQKLDRAGRESLLPLAEATGRVSGQGFLRLSGAADNVAGGQLEFRLDKLGVMQKPEQWLVLSGTGRLQLAENKRLNVDARLDVDGGYWRLADMGAPKRSDDVIVTRASQNGETRADGETPLRTDLAVDIDLGSRLYFVGAGVYSRLRGALRIAGQSGEPPRATGSIRVADGRFDAYGQRLDIEQGILTFNGLAQNPSLNIRAMRKNQAVEAGVSITGTAQKPVIRLVSEPNVPDAEKLSWLVFGEAPDEQSGTDYATLLTAAQAILGGQDGGNALIDLQRSLGVNISMGKSGNSRAPTSQVAQTGGFGTHADDTAQSQVIRVGTRLADGLTLSYEQSIAGTESVLKLTYALTRRLSLVGQTGSDNALDIFYSFRFGGVRDQGAGNRNQESKTRFDEK
ncbi:MAG: translocation/assembly module TamB domain-containing protein [Zoogloeaceae bacterium]|jgi:autotransporter translocation and assembly factor TamB|nr:translocation/assembly module TamB domain-containing protein [Zoogloeaceae bacterium]